MTTNTDLHGAMPELLPCPFCGGKPAFVPRAVNIVLQKDPSAPKFGVSVICGQCSSESPNMVDEAHAANKWNTRAAIEQAAGAVPEGWKLVPVEPDSNMINSAPDAWHSWKSRDNGGSIQQLGMLMWERYLTASPAPPKQQPDSVHLAACAGGGVTQPLDDEMDAVAIFYAHTLALELETVLSQYSGTHWGKAIKVLGDYRSAMNQINERESPTFMGEPKI